MKTSRLLPLIAVLFLAACQSERQVVEVTRIVPEEIVAEVTVPVEVTRVVETIRQIEVTRELAVIREIEVTREVTRLVEVPVTVTTSPTPEATATSTAVAQASGSGTAGATTPNQLLASMRALRRNVQLLANDQPGFITCSRGQEQSITDNYEAVIAYPTYNVGGASAVVQDAYNRYRQAIEIIRETNRDLYQQCVNWLAGTVTSSLIPFQTWGPARQGVNTALSVLEPGIAALESRP